MKTLYPTLCTAALLMLAACTQDPVEDLVSSGNTQSGDLPEGTFIVDYLPSADLPATRGLGEGEAILSLDYLLYEESTDGKTYTLTKHKEISDISADTPWPLTRENMTWAQRQELKDTLSTESKYKVVFVANADKDKVWKNKTDFQPMTNVVVKTVTEDGTETVAGSTFDQARLLLPPNGDFQQADGKYTFYYMWTGEIDPATNGYNKNAPAQMQVKLQRMVNKVEIRLEEEVVNELKEATSVEEYVKGKLEKYYKDHYINKNSENTALYDENSLLYNVVDSYLQRITDEIGINSEPNHNIQKAQYNKYKFQELLKSSDSKQSVVKSISGDDCENATSNTDENYCCVMHRFIEMFKSDIITHCDWREISSVTVIYTAASYPYAIDFNRKTQTEAKGEQPISIHTQKETNSENPYDNRYVFYIFSNNEDTDTDGSTETDKLNAIKEVQFFTKNETEENVYFSTTCDIIPGDAPTTGNNYYYLTYQPIYGLEKSDDTFNYTKQNYNMQTVIGWDLSNKNEDDSKNIWSYLGGTWTQSQMQAWVNGLFSKSNEENYFVPYELSLDIPKIKPTWNTENANQTE